MTVQSSQENHFRSFFVVHDYFSKLVRIRADLVSVFI